MNQGSGKVLYHGISSYQLLEVILHRLLFHREEEAVLLLPDFIREKYPQWEKLSHGFFDEVRLFPYLNIPHGEENRVVKDTAAAYESLDLPPLEEFSRIYIAGAHFYFSLYVISRGRPFSFFEDAAGMLSRPEEAAKILAAKFPQHAALAQSHGLFSGDNPLIQEVFCCWDAQLGPVETKATIWDFSVERALKALPWGERRRLVKFFVERPIKTKADTILLTQQFSGLGLLGEEEQRSLYRELAQGPLAGRRLLVKPHPDDRLDYREVFPGAEVMREVFPAELLPYVFRGHKPKTAAAFGSASLSNLGESFRILRLPLQEASQPQERQPETLPFQSGDLAGHPSM
ncbi:putative uncharacterized protein [Clostridium sp. CAG:1013]|nr:putative uncharacterized protein [Clostridium sp. CAG:1013]